MVVITKQLLNNFYIKEKMSVAQIADFLKCSEHKINYWIKKFGIEKRSLSDAMYARHNPDGDPFKIKEIDNINDAKLFGIGLGLYWGEGNKKNKNSIRLGNTDPDIIKTFIDFLINILGAKKEKLKFGLQVFSDMFPNKTLNFWLNNLSKYDINKRQFFKTTVTPSRSLGNYREKSKYGVLTVHFCNTKLKKIIDSMLPK